MPFLKIENGTNRILGQFKVRPDHDPATQVVVETGSVYIFSPSYTVVKWTYNQGDFVNTGEEI